MRVLLMAEYIVQSNEGRLERSTYAHHFADMQNVPQRGDIVVVGGRMSEIRRSVFDLDKPYVRYDCKPEYYNEQCEEAEVEAVMDQWFEEMSKCGWVPGFPKENE